MEMMKMESRRIGKEDFTELTEPESEVKGVVLMIFCFLYTIALFLFAAIAARAQDSITEKVTDQVGDGSEIWEQTSDKYVVQRNIRTIKAQHG